MAVIEEGSRKFLAAVVFGVLSLIALVLIILLKQFTPAVFTAWMTGTAGLFGVYMGANVVSKFSPSVVTEANTESARSAAEDEAKRVKAAKPQELGGDGLLGVSKKIKEKLATPRGPG